MWAGNGLVFEDVTESWLLESVKDWMIGRRNRATSALQGPAAEEGLVLTIEHELSKDKEGVAGEKVEAGSVTIKATRGDASRRSGHAAATYVKKTRAR